MENLTRSKDIGSSNSDDGIDKTPWKQPKPNKTTQLVDQTNDSGQISTTNRFTNLTDRKWIMEDIHKSSDIFIGSNKIIVRKGKTTKRKDVEVGKSQSRMRTKYIGKMTICVMQVRVTIAL